jgi:Meiotically up-regulated gene 113
MSIGIGIYFLFPLPTVARYTYPFNMRERILAEIKRIAEANSGVAPGQSVFVKETGFKPHELDKYWARWGDAVEEAGLIAQEWNTKLDAAFFYPRLAEAIRHYKRIPTNRELQLFRNTHPEIPHSNTLRNHFDSKIQMSNLLRQWASMTEGYADIVALLPENQAPEKEKIDAVKEGYVYLIKSGKRYKLGHSGTIERRFKEISVSLPDVATIYHHIRTDDPPGIESYWHRRFADKRLNGEWFDLNSSDLAAFRKRKYQ